MSRTSRRLNKAAKPLKKAGPVAEKPTPEMMARVEFEFGPVKTEMNIQIGAAYRRRPLFMTMALKQRDRFTIEQIGVMTEYRATFDRCERSPFASCLAEKHGGGGIGPASFIHASPAVVDAKRKLALIERGLGHSLLTMRDVVLHDRSFSEIALERFGGRRRSWIKTDEPVILNGKAVVIKGKPVLHGVHREDVVARSSDRLRISDDFTAGLRLLETAVARLRGGEVDEMWVHPREDGTAIIHRASIAPNGLFRVWGPARTIEAVLDDLLAKHGDRLVFSSPTAARDALIAAAAGRLHQLQPEEVAA